MRHELNTLSDEDVLVVHERVCSDFAATVDPIDPPGVRSHSLLASAVARQHTGFQGAMKYPDPIENAATLLFGLCNDHPFHNGNKRTALVAALAHLDKNRYVLRSTKERELVRLMVDVADHKIVRVRVKRGRDHIWVPRRGTADQEVAAVAEWLRGRTERLTLGEAQITYRELKRILKRFDYVIANPRNMKVSICRIERKRGLLLRGRETHKPVMTIDWPGEGRKVARSTLKQIRRTLELEEKNGVDRAAFYGDGVRVDAFINQYRTVLRKLATK